MSIYHFCVTVNKSKVNFGQKHNGMYKVVKFGKTINVQIMVDFVHNYGVNVIIIVSINVQIIANILNTIFVQTIVDFVHNNGFWCEPVINNACYFIITLTWNVAMGMTNIFLLQILFYIEYICISEKYHPKKTMTRKNQILLIITYFHEAQLWLLLNIIFDLVEYLSWTYIIFK